jgi:hypothetical protein
MAGVSTTEHKFESWEAAPERCRHCTGYATSPIHDPFHRVVVSMDGNDDFPVVDIECSWDPDDPKRPCRVVDCRQCEENACDECLTEHGASPVPGCGIKLWLDEAGLESIAVHNLRLVSAAVDVRFTDEWWEIVAP